ncbi:MAG: hypothetical protein JWQ94_573 [Tardiphaga sp.]|jgi:hypothetical protein|nr:hypothetical protein [Tardiphaga sp.]
MGQMHQIENVDLSTFTPDSLRYRQKAASLGQRASIECDVEKVRAMLDLAVSWIQLAENEELMASESRAIAE